MENETFIFTSLWLERERNYTRSLNNNFYFSCLLLLLCGDVERLPGPSRSMPDLENLCSKKGIKIVHQNAQGLLKNFDEIRNVLESFKIDIFTLSETHITTEHNNIFEISGYSFLSRIRTNGTWGGVAIYISDVSGYFAV